MICPCCRNSGSPIPGYVRVAWEGPEHVWEKCPDCVNGVSSCCDASGSAQPEPEADHD